MLGSLQFGGGSSILSMNQTMNNTLKEAALTTIKIHDDVDTYKLPADTKIKIEALGQCLRSMLQILNDEPNKTNTAQC